MVLFFIVVTLISIIYQDFKSRTIDIFSLVLFIILSFVYFKYQECVETFQAIYAFSFILFQIIVLHLIYFIKTKEFEFIFDKQIGWGDILFWIGLCFSFSFVQFLLFYIISLLITTIIAKIKQYKYIPLAGGQAICLLLILMVDVFFIKYNRFSDFFFIKYLP